MKVMQTEGAQEVRRQDVPAKETRSIEVKVLEEIVASSGITPRIWRLYAYFWLVFLFFPVIYLVRTPLAPLSLFAALAGLVIFVSVYFWVMWPYPLSDRGRVRSRWRSSWLVPVGLTLLVLYLSLAYGMAFSWLFLGIGAIIGIMLPARRAFWAAIGLTLFTLVVSVAASGGIGKTDWLQVIPLVLLVRGLGLDITGLKRLADALWELNAARQELARQSVMEERLRMARDLHDLLGHTLSMITLKSELARRLVEKDAAQATREVVEIEHVARQALREVREAIAGYRQETLASELDGARQILEAAGISCKIELTDEVLPPGVDVALAWTVREGVTNVIRHSHAKQCLIRIANQGGIVRAEVINDGFRGSDQPVSETGTGLSGLVERIAAQGGDVDAGPIFIENRQGFRLAVELPIQSSLDRKEVQHK